ncbi:MAG: hypothetical protein JWO13_3272 [Acidobacteriales bacterium]|nr:hypothetical protein [Terriglobales bacterium]
MLVFNGETENGICCHPERLSSGAKDLALGDTSIVTG